MVLDPDFQVAQKELDGLGLLPAGSNLIHVGPHKTGSTSIQSAFRALTPQLHQHGVHYAGGGQRVRLYLEPLGFPGLRGAKPRQESEWAALLAELADNADKRTLVSSEMLGRADDEQARQAIEHLGGTRPHVLMVARRYDTYLPSHWQQVIKGRETLSYAEYLERAIHGDDSDVLWRRIWLPHNTARQVRRWAAVVGMDAVTVVISDDRDRAFVPGVFERMLGLPDGILLRHVGRANVSLTYPEVELLRQFVITLKRHEATLEDFHDIMRSGVLRALHAGPRPAEGAPVPPPPEWAMEPLRQRSDQRIDELEELRAQGLRILGDTERIRIPEDAPVAADVASPTDVPLEVAARFNAAVVQGEMKRRKKRRQRARTQQALAVKPTARPPARRARILSRLRGLGRGV